MTGVGLVTIGGQQQPAMRLGLDPAKLANIGLTLVDAHRRARYHRHHRQGRAGRPENVTNAITTVGAIEKA